MLDHIKETGFRYATRGYFIGIDDMVIPPARRELVDEAARRSIEVEQQYMDGAITNGERYNKVIADLVGSDGAGRRQDVQRHEARTKKAAINPIYVMADSGARGSKQQIRQLAGMRGLMAKPSGEIIETPITANFREGLNVFSTSSRRTAHVKAWPIRR